MVQHLHDVPFIDYRLDLLLADQLVLAHDLHRVESTCIFLTDQDDSAECTSSNDFYLLEVMACHLHIRFLVGCESQFCKMCTQELAILEDAEWPVVLGEPEVKSLAHVQCFQGNDELLLQFDLLVDDAHSLFTGVSAYIMYDLQILVRVLLIIDRYALILLLVLLPLPLLRLLLEHLIIFSDDFALQPAAGGVGVEDVDGELDVALHEDLDLLDWRLW